MRYETPGEVIAALDGVDYLADEGLATVVLLALGMPRPLFLEGEPGAGKTELARALATVLGAPLLRVQCYEGIDASQALYDWDHARQLLHLRAVEAAGQAEDLDAVERDLYTERFLLARPLLEAIRPAPGAAPPVLLIDEIDRADDEFEAFLLELLGEWSVTIPELGTYRAAVPPVAVLTSNRTRDVHDALKRRCLYHWVDHPSLEREIAIVRRRVPGIGDRLAAEVAAAVGELRSLDLYKPPGVAETVDWAEALAVLGVEGLGDARVAATLGTVVKHREDEERVRAHGLPDLVRVAVARSEEAAS